MTEENGLIVREMLMRSTGVTGNEFTGIGVPFGETIEVSDWMFGRHKESFEPGSVDAEGAKIIWRHGEVIGKMTAGKDTDAGYEVTGKISDTTLGRDAATLLADGVVDRLSIGFKPLEWRESEDGDITYTKVRALEFSLVPWPAYDSATITQVRHSTPASPVSKGNSAMTEDTLTRSDLNDVNDSLALLQRRFDALPSSPAAPETPQFRSMGEFIKAIAAGDESAAEFHREFTGGVVADTVMKDSFIGDHIKLVDERRRLTNTFSRGVLPSSGMSVDYTQLKSDNTQVAEQVKEGDDLVSGKVQLEDKNAPVKTFGGWTELSLQAILRATVPTLNTTFRALAIKYAQTTEAWTRKTYLDLIAKNLADATPDAFLKLPATAEADDWLDLIVDAGVIYEDRGFALTGLHVSADKFKELLRLKDGDNRLMTVQGTGVNQVGSLNLKNADGSLANLPVSILRGPATGRIAFYDPLALETLESPGAPAQLQDENIINLTKSFSLYGFMSVITPFPQAVLPVKVGA